TMGVTMLLSMMSSAGAREIVNAVARGEEVRDENGNITLAVETETTATATAETERVIVTGSNIPTAEEVGPNPVTIYTRDILRKSGERHKEQILQNLTHD